MARRTLDDSRRSFLASVEDQVANSGEYTTITKASNPTISVPSWEIIMQLSSLKTTSPRSQRQDSTPFECRWVSGSWLRQPRPVESTRVAGVYTRNDRVLGPAHQILAKKHNVAVLISLHAAKGSQNGADHSSPASPGHPLWSQYSENVANTIEVARFLADRYLTDEAFLGIGLLNEPNGSTDEKVLYQYYKDAYQAKQSPDEMVGFMEAPEFTNVWVEWHPYFIWGRVDKWNARPGHNRLFMGEWSVATASNMRRTNPDLFYTFAMEQLKVHEAAEGGWTLWTWKASAGSKSDVEDWSLQKLLADDRLGRILRSNS
ncbi:Glycoside hydrolase, family 5, conserved site [Phytophthora cactorum]|nr:Glycoside hydrolase, family 5, conserved site [Phytophthora cactorum]